MALLHPKEGPQFMGTCHYSVCYCIWQLTKPTLPILTVCAILSFAVGNLNCVYSESLRSTLKGQAIFYLCDFPTKDMYAKLFLGGGGRRVFLAFAPFFVLPFCSFVSVLWYILWYISFGALEKDLVMLGLCNCSPYLCT